MQATRTRLAYVERTLTGPLSPERRQALTAKAAEYRQALAGHCARCGRSIQGAGPYGPECSKVAA